MLTIYALTLFLTSFVTLADASVLPRDPPARREITSTHKAGLAWGGGNDDAMERFASTGKVQWYYTWSPRSYIRDAPVEFVPMLWGERQIEEWVRTINDTLEAGGVTTILGMNEPQETGQSNMSAQEGAAMWKEYINPLLDQYPELELGSPSPSGAPSGKTWLLEFLDECDGCTVDFIACHWYDINATQFIEYMEDFHDTFERPIAVTEWSCQNFNTDDQCTEEEVVEFLNITQTWMDETDWIKMYAYFGSLTDLQGVNEDNRLMESNGKLTALGSQYIGGDPNASDEDNAARSMTNFANAFLMLFIVQLAWRLSV